MKPKVVYTFSKGDLKCRVVCVHERLYSGHKYTYVSEQLEKDSMLNDRWVPAGGNLVVEEDNYGSVKGNIGITYRVAHETFKAVYLAPEVKVIEANEYTVDTDPL